jgi:ubiquinone/menaquinone biosynthesis C-methylase UbiE
MYPATLGKFADPQTIATHFHLHRGDMVADFGAGDGAYMKSLSDAVGPGGKVYLCEIQKNLVEKLGIKSRELRVHNVHPLWCDFETSGGTKLKDGALDAGLLSNCLFQISDKMKALGEIARVIKKGGKLFVIEWSDSFGGMGPAASHVVDETAARSFLEPAGFSVEQTFPAGDHHYGLSCRKK